MIFSKNSTKFEISVICLLHYVKLCYRSVLLLAAGIIYLIGRLRGSSDMFGGYEKDIWILGVIWLVYAVEMTCILQELA